MIWIGLLKSYFCQNELDYATSNILFKDKYFMRSIAQGIVLQSKFAEVNSIQRAQNFIFKNGKSVIKPRQMDSAKGIIVVENIEDNRLNAIDFEQSQLMVETYCDLKNMVTVDGFSNGKEIEELYFHEYFSPLLNAINSEEYIGVRTSRLYFSNAQYAEKTRLRLRTACAKILGKISCRDEVTPFHFEFFL